MCGASIGRLCRAEPLAGPPRGALGDDEMRRLFVLLAVVAGLSVAATPVLAADNLHYRERGSGVSAYFSNFEWDEDGNLPPGTYAEVYVDAASYVARGDGAWQSDYVCVSSWSVTVTPEGEWIDESGFGWCGEGASISLAKKLGSANMVASFEVLDCLAWDEESGECLDEIDLGTLEVDLSFTGAGPLERYHGTSGGGVPGEYKYTYHGNGVQRSADVFGTVTLDDDSLIEDATMTGGWLFQTRNGYMEVWH